jgi:hypothetical protein
VRARKESPLGGPIAKKGVLPRPSRPGRPRTQAGIVAVRRKRLDGLRWPPKALL